MTVSSIATARVSDSLIRQQLLEQLQTNQTDLLRLQQQVSSGRRIALPSDDAPAAQRAISLQRLLEQKTQIKTNLTTNQTFLNSTDSALSQLSSLIANVRGDVLAVVGSTSSDTERAAASQNVDRAIQAFLGVANQQFRGRYLFAGSNLTTAPFDSVSNGVQYNGNEDSINTYSDTNLLFPTNLQGNEVFGAISSAVKGTALSPNLTPDTRLADLRGGQGITRGTIELSDGLHTSLVDISNAETIGDVAKLIDAHPPAGQTITTEVTEQGLVIKLQGTGNLVIREVAAGTTVRELGILNETGSNTTVSQALNPKLTLTTSLKEILGTRARADISLTGGNNDFVIEAKDRGTQYNGVNVVFVGGGTAGSESAALAVGTLTVTIEDGVSTVNDVLNAINNNAGLPFTARLGEHDVENDGTGTISIADTGVFSGGSGVEFDQSSGLVVTTGGEDNTISLSNAKTVEDVLNILNGANIGVLAQINQSGTGIDIRSRVSGADFSIGENGGTTATALGVRTFNLSTPLSSLNHGLGVRTSEGTDFTIRRTDGVELQIDLNGASTIGDVIQRINTASAGAAGVQVTAQLAAVGNGIQLVATDAAPTSTLKVKNFEVAQGAVDLGLIADGSAESSDATIVGTVSTLTGRDTNPQEVQGIFNALVRLRDALRDNDQAGIERGVSLLDDGNTQVNFARAELGARGQALDAIQSRLDNEETDLKQTLSGEIDIDLAQAISDLVARQTSLQASLQVASRSLQQSLLDYL